MALFKPGPTISAASGSAGGVVFSHNRGGMYFRNRSIPTNPQTSYQNSIRQILSELSAQWGAVADKAAWQTWAQTNPVTNALGEAVTLTGHQAYIQLNSRIRQSGDTVITLPPVAVAPPALLTLSVVADVANTYCTLTFTGSPLAAADRLWSWACAVDNAGITNVNNRYRLIDISAKAQPTALELSVELSTRFGARILGQRIFIKCAVFDSVTGLLSAPKSAFTTVVAAI